ncbi:MAG TPA: hypothetical protein VHZ76_09450 [Gammaproteobacteria bacterium]|jgi:hypothetical protein|nr:hypothetical protein [Gammaproteobacteria bacterium]
MVIAVGPYFPTEEQIKKDRFSRLLKERIDADDRDYFENADEKTREEFLKAPIKEIKVGYPTNADVFYSIPKYAAFLGKEKVFSLFLEKRWIKEPLQALLGNAMSGRSIPIVRSIIEKLKEENFDLASVLYGEKTIIHCLAHYKQPGMAAFDELQELILAYPGLEKWLDKEKVPVDQDGDTPFHAAAAAGNLHAMKCFMHLPWGGEFNRKNAAGQTPFDLVKNNAENKKIDPDEKVSFVGYMRSLKANIVEQDQKESNSLLPRLRMGGHSCSIM